MTRDQYSDSSVPPNTVIVLPKPLPMNRGALWTLFWAIGILMGLFARGIVDGPEPAGLARGAGASAGPSVDAAEVSAAPTMVVHLRAILEMPSPTATSSPRPTTTATRSAAAGVDFCTAAEPGALCRVPYPAPPTPTPYPSCEEMANLAPGDWCVWPTPPVTLASRD